MLVKFETIFNETYKNNKSKNYPFVKLQEKFEVDGKDLIKMEYCPNGDLFDLIKCHGALPKEIADKLFLQILEAVSFMHSEC